MAEEAERVNPLFLQLVLSLHSAAMYQMGKTVSPISGKIEKDLAQAKISIDLLTMLQEKTSGNLLGNEKRILDSTVYNLQMNYVDELEQEKKGASSESSAGGEHRESLDPEKTSDDSGGEQ